MTTEIKVDQDVSGIVNVNINLDRKDVEGPNVTIRCVGEGHRDRKEFLSNIRAESETSLIVVQSLSSSQFGVADKIDIRNFDRSGVEKMSGIKVWNLINLKIDLSTEEIKDFAPLFDYIVISDNTKFNIAKKPGETSLDVFVKKVDECKIHFSKAEVIHADTLEIALMEITKGRRVIPSDQKSVNVTINEVKFS